MRPEKISVSTQTTHIDLCPPENSISKLIELLTKFLNLCQNSDNLNIAGCLTRIAEETFAAPTQTTLTQNGTVPKTSSRTIKDTAKNKIAPSPFNDKNTYVVTDSQLQTPVINLSNSMDRLPTIDRNRAQVINRPRKISRIHSPGPQKNPAPLTPTVIEIPIEPSPIIGQGRKNEKHSTNNPKGRGATPNLNEKYSNKESSTPNKKLQPQKTLTKCLPIKK
jgi:hypothetical protein